MSFNLLQKSKLAKLVETIPPTGNQPVRTANKSKIRKSRRSGIVKSADVLKAHARSHQVPLLAALQIPSGMARSQARSVAMVVRKSVFRARAHRREATGVLYENENPMSPFSTE